MTKRRKQRETDARRRADERLQAIVEGTATKIGSAFFRSLVQHLAVALDVKNVFVGEVAPSDPQRIQSLAIWSGAGFAENFEYSLVDTPCESVMSGAICFYARHVQQNFPRDRMLTEIGAESYLGMPLVGSSGASLGLLVAMDDRPMVEDPRDRDLLKIFAVRAGAELERRRAEAALSASELRSRLIIETTRDAVITIDVKSIVTGWNARAEETFGWSEAEAIGRDLTELIIPPELREAHHAGLLRFLETGQGPLLGRRVEIDGLHKNGRRLPLELAIATMHSGGAYEFSAFVQDISERKRAEAERRRLESQVQYAQKLESLGVLAGGIAHDSNNILTGILGNAVLAKRDLPEKHPVQKMLGEIVESSRLAVHLTGQLLDYAGQGRIQSRPIDLSDEVREIEALLRTAVRGRARLELDLQDDLPAIQADGSQIQQVLINLAINAAESSEDEVEVRIRTRKIHLEDDALSFLVPGSQLGAGHHVALEVEDDGCGFDAMTQQRIFDPFFTTKTSGRGLGLASILGIVHRHGGGIHVRSTPGSGTRFRVLFPALERCVQSRVEPRPANSSGGKRVLAVDDDEYVLRVVQHVLEGYDYSAILAASGEEAIEIYRERHAEIDLVLLDLSMPVMDGEATFAALREICPDACVLLSSGHDAPDVTRRLTADGLAGVVRKPFTPDELVAAVVRTIGVSSGEGSSPKSRLSFDALRSAYEAKLPGLLGELAAGVAACRTARAGTREQRLREVQRLSHKLKGTTGSYDFREISEALEGIERMLGKIRAGTTTGESDWAMIEKTLARASDTLRNGLRSP